MRIVVSGTHASGKSTLVADFARRHPEFTVLPDPFEFVDEAWDSPSAAMFTAQLRIAADRLVGNEWGESIVAERGPLDFLAYLLAMADLTGGAVTGDVLERATAMTAAALDRVDLLVVLPLEAGDPIHVGTDEHLDLREAMNDALLDLVDDPDITGSRVAVVEITGDPGVRLATLERLVESVASRRVGGPIDRDRGDP